jgi:predicted transcriptional regulator
MVESTPYKELKQRIKDLDKGEALLPSDESASDIGIKAFVYKPIVKSELAKTIRKLLDEAKKKM